MLYEVFILFSIFSTSCFSKVVTKKCNDCASTQCLSAEALGCPNNSVLDQCGCCPKCVQKGCLNCELVRLDCPSVESLGCPSDYEIDPCLCCPRCLKVEGEKCGGPDNYYGSCTNGLICKHPNGPGNQSRGKTCMETN